jgi:dipeptidyl aminopeptidase/acylaminoacyl peptidase
LLVHGEEDGIVPISQSDRMKKAMDAAGKKAEFIRIPEEGHMYWEDKNEKKVMSAIQVFLAANLGPGLSN